MTIEIPFMVHVYPPIPFNDKVSIASHNEKADVEFLFQNNILFSYAYIYISERMRSSL